MKKLILLTICTILLLTGCGQAAAPEVDTVPAIVQEETIPTTDAQDVPTGIAEVAVEPTISEIPAQSNTRPLLRRWRNPRSLCQPNRQQRTHPHRHPNLHPIQA